MRSEVREGDREQGCLYTRRTRRGLRSRLFVNDRRTRVAPVRFARGVTALSDVVRFRVPRWHKRLNFFRELQPSRP